MVKASISLFKNTKIDWKLASEWDKPLYFNIKPEYRTMQGFGAHSPLLLAPLKMFDLPPCCLSRGSEEGFGRKFCYCMMPKSQPRLTAKPLNSLSATHSWFFAYDATKIWQKSWKKLSIVAVQYGRTGVEFSRGGGTKLERFLPKNLHTQRKLLNFENWVNGEVSKIEHHFSK